MAGSDSRSQLRRRARQGEPIAVRVVREGPLLVLHVEGFGVTQAERPEDVEGMVLDYLSTYGVANPQLSIGEVDA